MQHKIGSKRIWTISGFHIPSEFFPQLSLIFVIRIPCDADQLDAVRISESSIEITAVFFDLLLTGGRFFYGKLSARRLANLLAVQARRQDALAGALVQVVHLFLGLGKGEAYLLLGQVGGVAVQRVHDAGNKTVRCGTAGLRRCADLPLQGLLVGVRVDVRLLQKAERHTAVVQCFIECTALLGAAAHAGNTVKHDGIPGLYTVQQLVQLLPSAAGRAGVDLADDVRRGVGSGNVAHLAFDILLRCGNAAVAVHGHTVSLLTFG